MKLLYRKHTHTFRSPGLRVFLRILRDAYPGWVDMAGIDKHLPGIHPGQLARFIDLLETKGLPLVRYETKTRGRFQLAVKPESVVITGEQLPPSKVAPTTSARFTPVANATLDMYQDEAWVTWCIALMLSTVALHNGHISGKEGALDYLDMAEAATRSLPLWTVSVVNIRRAFMLGRESRYREAAYWLRRVDTAVRNGHAHPAAKTAAQLVRAKLHYDQAHYAKAERVLGVPTASPPTHHPHWLNMNALLDGRKFLAAKKAEAPALLLQTLSALAEAMGGVFLSHGDSSLLDALCYNFANNLLRGIRSGIIPATCADTVIQWLTANILVFRKLGVGDDSIYTSLLLIDVAVEHGYSAERWPHLLRCEMDACGDLDGVLARALAQARRVGNKLEIALCLLHQMKMPSSPTTAKRAYIEALEIFGKQGREDLVADLDKVWKKRFGKLPHRRLKGSGA